MFDAKANKPFTRGCRADKEDGWNAPPARERCGNQTGRGGARCDDDAAMAFAFCLGKEGIYRQGFVRITSGRRAEALDRNFMLPLRMR